MASTLLPPCRVAPAKYLRTYDKKRNWCQGHLVPVPFFGHVKSVFEIKLNELDRLLPQDASDQLRDP